jgi:cation:H+ antiporter
MISFLLLVFGILLLAAGGEVLIRGALAAASRFQVSPLLSGLFIVGFGTSTPELVVSVDAAISHQPEIAIGNVVGSNIANILLILGICALINPLAVKPSILKRDAISVLLACSLLMFLINNQQLGRLDGAILLLAFAGYLGWAYWSERLAFSPSSDVYQHEAQLLTKVPHNSVLIAIAVIGSLLVLIAGSKLLLSGATGIATLLGVPKEVIGLTVVAVGTSLPELTISVIAAIRGQSDVAVGNILGSNIFNTLAILGLSGLVNPLVVGEGVVQFDQWIMLAASVVLTFFLITGRKLSRFEGLLLLFGYLGYVWISFTP